MHNLLGVWAMQQGSIFDLARRSRLVVLFCLAFLDPSLYNEFSCFNGPQWYRLGSTKVASNTLALALFSRLQRWVRRDPSLRVLQNC